MGNHDENDDGFTEFLEQIVNMNHLDGAALGITKLVIDKGEDALSEKQRYIFQKEVLDEFTIEECERCGSNIPWSEMYDAVTEHSLCNYCWHMTSKDND